MTTFYRLLGIHVFTLSRSPSLQIRVRFFIFILFLNNNICCGYKKPISTRRVFFALKRMFRLMVKWIIQVYAQHWRESWVRKTGWKWCFFFNSEKSKKIFNYFGHSWINIPIVFGSIWVLLSICITLYVKYVLLNLLQPATALDHPTFQYLNPRWRRPWRNINNNSFWNLPLLSSLLPTFQAEKTHSKPTQRLCSQPHTWGISPSRTQPISSMVNTHLHHPRVVTEVALPYYLYYWPVTSKWTQALETNQLFRVAPVTSLLHGPKRVFAATTVVFGIISPVKTCHLGICHASKGRSSVIWHCCKCDSINVDSFTFNRFKLFTSNITPLTDLDTTIESVASSSFSPLHTSSPQTAWTNIRLCRQTSTDSSIS